MDFCTHDGLDISRSEYGDIGVTHAGRRAAFPLRSLASGEWGTVVDGDRITVCGNVVYEVEDWEHDCPGLGEMTALARLVSASVHAF